VSSPVPDQTIINNVLNGDTSQYNELILRHKDYAYSLALKILRNPQDAEEVAHDAFIKAFNALKGFNHQAKFSTWLYRIVFNTAVSHQRKHKIVTEDIAELKAEPISNKTSNEPLLKQDQQRFVQEAMAKLVPLDTSLITLFYMKQLNLDEIGEIVGLKPNLVKVKLFRARKRLARELEKILHTEVVEII